MRQKESLGAIFATGEAHSTQRGQLPRMLGHGLWRYEQKEQRVTSVPMIGVNCDLWCMTYINFVNSVVACLNFRTFPNRRR